MTSKVDAINELTSDVGVTIEGVLVKENSIDCNNLVVNDSVILPQFTDMTSPSGFINTTDQLCTIVDGSRTVIITPAVSTFSYYSDGIKYTKDSSEDIIFLDDEGTKLIYYDGETLSKYESPTLSQIIEVIQSKCIVCWIYWDTTNNVSIYFTGNNEFHGINMDGNTHAYLHVTHGAQFISGCALNTLDTDQDGDTNSHAQFGIDTGVLRDEDLTVSLTAVSSTVGCPIYYRSGSDWRRQTNTGYSVLTAGTGRIAYDNAGSLTECPNNDFVLYHVFGFNDSTYQFITIMGQNYYTTLSNARTGAQDEINNIVLAGLPFAEMITVATVIFQTSTGYDNAVKGRILTDGEGNDWIDWRLSTTTATIYPANHSLLINLSYDDHQQYANLNGRSGGQQLIGGTASGDDLTFDTTSDGTKGSYIFTDITTASRLSSFDGSKGLVSVSDLTAWIGGTSNEITVTDDADGTVTLSLPTEIHVDTIIESSNNTGVTIEYIKIEDRQIEDDTNGNRIQMNSSTGMKLRSGGTGEIFIEGNQTNGEAKLNIQRVLPSDVNYLDFSTVGTSLWRFENSASNNNFKLYNYNTATNALSINYTTNNITYDGSIFVDSISEKTASNGVTIESINIEGNRYQRVDTGFGFDFSNNFLRVYRDSGAGQIKLTRTTDSSFADIFFTNAAVNVWNVGLNQRVTSNDDHFKFYNANYGGNPLTIADTTGIITTPATYSHDMNGETMRDVQVNNSGELGYDSGSLSIMKTNVIDSPDVSWIYELDVKSFNYKKRVDNATGFTVDDFSATEYWPKTEFGVMAEQMETKNSDLCFYDVIRDLDEECPVHKEIDPNPEESCTCGSHNELRGIHYKKLIIPLLKALQEQKNTIDALESRITTLEAFH